MKPIKADTVLFTAQHHITRAQNNAWVIHTMCSMTIWWISAYICTRTHRQTRMHIYTDILTVFILSLTKNFVTDLHQSPERCLSSTCKSVHTYTHIGLIMKWMSCLTFSESFILIDTCNETSEWASLNWLAVCFITNHDREWGGRNLFAFQWHQGALLW